MYIAPGQTTPWGQMLMSTESPYHFANLLQVLKQSLWSMILNTFQMILYMYIAPGQGQTSPWGQNFDVNRNSLSLCPFVSSLKKNLFEVWFFTVLYVFFLFFCFFCLFSHIYRPRQEQTTHWKQTYDNRKAFSLFPYDASLKMIFSKSDFIHIFNDFIHVYSPGARAENPSGTNILCQQKALWPFITSFKQISLNSDFEHIF